MLKFSKSAPYIPDPVRSRPNITEEDKEKVALLEARDNPSTWVRTKNGQGEIFRLPLISKLVLLAIIKFGTRDPHGMAAEMEGAPTVVATGGLAQTIADVGNEIDIVDPLLTLKGLRAVYEKNKGPRT